MIGVVHVRQWQASSGGRRNGQSMEREGQHASTADVIIIRGCSVIQTLYVEAIACETKVV